MKRYLKDKCKESPSKKQYFVPETQEPPHSPIFKGENWKPHPHSPKINKSLVSLLLENTSDQYIAGVHRSDTRDLLVAGVSVLSFFIFFNFLSFEYS